MPKIIKNPEDRILQAARNRLLDKDLSSFSLRGVAADCGIAVGTIYNYFKDKESLMAAVMIHEFSMRYRKRHELLLSQITEMIKGLYERFDAPCEEHRTILYAELIIAGAQHPEIREEEIIEIIV